MIDVFKDAILGILPLFHSLAQMANIMLPLSAICVSSVSSR